MPAKLIAQTILTQIMLALLDGQRGFKIDGKDFLPLGYGVEDGSGLRYLVEGYFAGSYEKVEVFVDFSRMNHTFQF